MRTILLALFLLSVSCSLPFFTYEDDVVVLTDENYEQALYEFDYALIEFYAPWCGHCKTLAPQFAEAAKQLAKTNPEVKLCKVDATKEVKFAKKYEIRGYPTLYFFVKGRKSPLFFHHNKNAEEIVEWVQRKATIASEAIKSLEDAEKFIDSNEVALIFFGDSNSEAFKGYLETANNFDGVVFGHTNDDQVREKYGVQVNENSPETIVLFKKFDEGKNYFNGPFDFESIVNFIEKNRFPLVFPFDHRFSRKIFGDGNDVLFLVTDKQDAGVAAEEIFRQIATEIKGKIVFCLARIEEPMVDMLMGLVGVSKEELPAIRIMQPSQRNQKYAMNSEINGENIKKFVEDFMEKRLPVYFKSEPIPENSYEDDVRIVVGKDFKEVVLDENKDVLMVYYAPLCSPCKEMAPTYASLAASLKNVEGLVIGKMDLTKNEAEGLKTQGFPTIRFYPRGNKSSPIDFPGERTEEGFLDFLKKHTTLPIEKLEKPTDIEL